jgi:hypothetical protein
MAIEGHGHDLRQAKRLHIALDFKAKYDLRATKIFTLYGSAIFQLQSVGGKASRGENCQRARSQETYEIVHVT